MSNAKLSKREIVLLSIALLLFYLVQKIVWLESVKPNVLDQIDSHLRVIRPRWNDFRRDHDGFELVEFFVGTGKGGAFAASGYVPSTNHLKQLESFMESTQPPRPIMTLGVKVVEQESFDAIKEFKR